MAIKFNVSLAYKDLFQDYNQVNIQNLIADIPTKNAIEIMGYCQAQIHGIENDKNKQVDFLNKWIARFPADIKTKIESVIAEIESNSNAEFRFLSIVSVLNFTEILLQNENQKELADHLTPQQELDLFKGYLWASQKWTMEQKNNSVSRGKVITEEDAIKIILPSQMPYFELSMFKDLRWQFLKSIYFFHFCERDPQFKPYLDLFLKEYDLISWQGYLTHIIDLYLQTATREARTSVLNIPDEFPVKINFLETLCIDPKAIKASPDFLSLRERPIYRRSKNDFVFLNYNFFVDKIFQGIQFEFAKVLIKNKVEFNGKVIKSYLDFKNIYSTEFSENELFYSVMNYAFEKSDYIRFNGTQMKAALKEGEPDYYMRDKSKIYLFEFKDVLLEAKAKHSHKYEDIVAEISKKLVKNQNESPKGISQLVNVIERLRKNEFKVFDNYNFEEAIVYPIIVVTDPSLRMLGVNYMLNKEFRKLLHERNISKPETIKNLVLIDLDTFLKYQDYFRNKTIKLNNCLNEYYLHVTSPNRKTQHIQSFDFFMGYKMRAISYKSPKMLMDEIKAMLPLDENFRQYPLYEEHASINGNVTDNPF